VGAGSEADDLLGQGPCVAWLNAALAVAELAFFELCLL